jgi:hypothetical protein
MASLKLTNLASFKAYFADIANSHVAIDAFMWGDKDVIRNETRSLVMRSVLWAERYDNVRYADNLSDNIQKIKQARIGFFQVRDTEKFADEDAQFEFCESVIDDIIARIIKDKRGAQVDTEWQLLLANISSATGSPAQVMIGSTNFIGWQLKIDIMDNTNLAYDASKWNS